MKKKDEYKIVRFDKPNNDGWMNVVFSIGENHSTGVSICLKYGCFFFDDYDLVKFNENTFKFEKTENAVRLEKLGKYLVQLFKYHSRTDRHYSPMAILDGMGRHEKYDREYSNPSRNLAWKLTDEFCREKMAEIMNDAA